MEGSKVLDDIRRQWSEREFQDQLVKVARVHGWQLQYHTHDSRRSAAGFPDLVLINPTRKEMLVYELKTEKGLVTQAQMEWIQGFRLAGVRAGVRRPRDWDLILKELKGEYSASA